jgi:hypothetical protein
LELTFALHFKIKIMKTIRNITLFLAFILLFSITACEKFFDINKDPDSISDAPLSQIFTSATVNVGFTGGSDILRYSSLITQQFSGQSSGAETQTQQYEKFLISGSDLNNLWTSVYATTLNDLELVIEKANASNSPHYAGVAKLLKAYTYQMAVDTWGDIPFSESQKLTNNLSPKYDDDQTIYTSILALIDEGVSDLNQSTSTQSPGTNSTIYPGTFASSKPKWIKFANTLKLRIYMHYSEKDPAFATNQINQLVSNPNFFTSNDDNFEMSFIQTAGGQNPIYQFEIERPGYLAPHKTLVDMMLAKSDPRVNTYFNPPANGGNFVGSYGGAPSSPADYSTIGIFLTGNSGDAPVRMLTYAEYNFIRAEAALRFGVAGDPQTFFQEGIKASMEATGVSNADISTYIALNGLLIGTNEQKLQKIIEEKFVANFGVAVEPWTDWRRTGYPVLNLPANAVINFIPRSLYYPQSEIDLNPEATQKAGMDTKIFWDIN